MYAVPRYYSLCQNLVLHTLSIFSDLISVKKFCACDREKLIVPSTWKLAGIIFMSLETENLAIFSLFLRYFYLLNMCSNWQVFVFLIIALHNQISCKYGATCRYNHPDRNSKQLFPLYVQNMSFCLIHNARVKTFKFLQQSILLLPPLHSIWNLVLLVQLHLSYKALTQGWLRHRWERICQASSGITERFWHYLRVLTCFLVISSVETVQSLPSLFIFNLNLCLGN